MRLGELVMLAELGHEPIQLALRARRGQAIAVDRAPQSSRLVPKHAGTRVTDHEPQLVDELAGVFAMPAVSSFARPIHVSAEQSTLGVVVSGLVWEAHIRGVRWVSGCAEVRSGYVNK